MNCPKCNSKNIHMVLPEKDTPGKDVMNCSSCGYVFARIEVIIR